MTSKVMIGYDASYAGSAYVHMYSLQNLAVFVQSVLHKNMCNYKVNDEQ
jgi:hypothetical protein